MKCKFFSIFVFFFFSPLLFAQYIDIVGGFEISDIPTDWSFLKEMGYEVRIFNFTSHQAYLTHHYNEDLVDKVIINNDTFPISYLRKIPRDKLILILWEPFGIDESSWEHYKVVFTFYDKIVGKRHFRRFFYPYLQPMVENLPPFNERKLAVLVTRNWTLERCRVVEFYEKLKGDYFDLYSRNPQQFSLSSLYKGPIPGYHSGNEKINTVKNYKFSYCYENTVKQNYITEKIFACFAAGSVPIYFGAPNVMKFIPKNCYINYHDFININQIHKFISNMSEETYMTYIQNIRNFLKSDRAKIFSPEYFESLIRDAVQ